MSNISTYFSNSGKNQESNQIQQPTTPTENNSGIMNQNNVQLNDQTPSVVTSSGDSGTKDIDNILSAMNDIEEGKSVSVDNDKSNGDNSDIITALEAFYGEQDDDNQQIVTESKKNNTENENGENIAEKDSIEHLKSLKDLFEESAEKASKTIVEDSEKSALANEALNTKFDSQNNKVNMYEQFSIKINESEDEEDNKNMYDVIDEKNDVVVAKDLYMYESAYIIVGHLNNGKKYLDPDIRNVVYLEEKYIRARNNLIHLKENYKLAKRKKDYSKMDILEAKYDKAKSDAKSIKSYMREMLKERK